MQKIKCGTKTDNTYMAKRFERQLKEKGAHGNTPFVHTIMCITVYILFEFLHCKAPSHLPYLTCNLQ